MAKETEKSKSKWMQQFAKLSPRARMASIIGGLVCLVVLASVFMTPSFTPAVVGPAANETNLTIPTPKDVSNERLAADQAAMQQKINDTNQKIDQLVAQMNRVNEAKQAPANAAEGSNLDARLEELNAQVNKLLTEKDEAKQKLPPPATAGNGEGPGLDTALPKDEVPPSRVIKNATAPKPINKRDEKPKPVVYLPGPSMFEAVTLNGMDAPTNPAASKNPVPMVARVKSTAILPNAFTYDITECFVLTSGYGSMSSERAILRVENIACTREDGRVIEAKMEGYVVGEDGRVGMRGRLVSKQGQLIAQSLAAGTLSGLGQALTPSATPGLNLNSGTSYALPNPGAVASSAIGKGFSDTASSASKFFLELASQTTPVVEIDAARKITIVLTKGVELK